MTLIWLSLAWKQHSNRSDFLSLGSVFKTTVGGAVSASFFIGAPAPKEKEDELEPVVSVDVIFHFLELFFCLSQNEFRPIQLGAYTGHATIHFMPPGQEIHAFALGSLLK